MIAYSWTVINYSHHLVAFLTADTYFHKMYNQMTDDERTRLLRLLNGKGYYCYDYVTDGEVLKETSLPPLKDFNNVLKQEGPDPERYTEALEIWDLLKCRTMDDYTCIYNVMDSINLAVIMEQRMEMLKEYLFLDAPHFTSMSVYGAACAKFKARSIVQCMPNERVMEAIEQSTHGGFSNVGTRRSVSSANYEEPMYIRDR